MNFNSLSVCCLPRKHNIAVNVYHLFSCCSRTKQIFQDILLYCGLLFHLLFLIYFFIAVSALGDRACFTPFVFCNIPPEPCSCHISSDTLQTVDSQLALQR